jgi:hypothetical protein
LESSLICNECGESRQRFALLIARVEREIVIMRCHPGNGDSFFEDIGCQETRRALHGINHCLECIGVSQVGPIIAQAVSP